MVKRSRRIKTKTRGRDEKLRGGHLRPFQYQQVPPLCSTFLELFVFACNVSRLDSEDLLLFTTCNIRTQWPFLACLWDSPLGHYLSLRITQRHSERDGRTEKMEDNVKRREIKWFISWPKHNILLQEALCYAVSDVTFRRPEPGSARRITHWTRTIDHRRCLLLSVCPPSYRLPFFLFMSASPVLSAPSFCLSRAPHFSSSSICQPSPYPLLFLQSSL